MLDLSRLRQSVRTVVFAFLVIFIRCIHRIPELSGEWGNDLMQRELDFIVLESVMIFLTALALTILHLRWFFPAMGDTFPGGRGGRKMGKRGESWVAMERGMGVVTLPTPRK